MAGRQALVVALTDALKGASSAYNKFVDATDLETENHASGPNDKSATQEFKV